MVSRPERLCPGLRRFNKSQKNNMLLVFGQKTTQDPYLRVDFQGRGTSSFSFEARPRTHFSFIFLIFLILIVPMRHSHFSFKNKVGQTQNLILMLIPRISFNVPDPDLIFICFSHKIKSPKR